MRSIKRNDSINVVPFIDVLLVLLAIVFVISNFIALGKIEINLPAASNHESIKSVQVSISINKEGEFFVDDEPISKEELPNRIASISKEDTITIVSDKKATYEDFIFVVDILKNNNLEKISMAVEQ
ncbi:MAG: biopolymer transporter ExbD [Sulfuricurvum sp.]